MRRPDHVSERRGTLPRNSEIYSLSATRNLLATGIPVRRANHINDTHVIIAYSRAAASKSLEDALHSILAFSVLRYLGDLT
jgi:hypothetical protein